MQRYRILDQVIASNDEGLQALLLYAHSLHEPCWCLCQHGEEHKLYIARRGDLYVLARWPGTGALHAAHCDHYEAPDFLTGMGEVRGRAIVEDEVEGITDVRLAFPLARGSARAAPSAITNDKPSIKSTPQKLSMRGLLHYLWDKAQLTHWHPKMEGKRNWYIVRRELLRAASECRAKGDTLASRLFIPEEIDEKHTPAQLRQILARREAKLRPARISRNAILIVIGDVASITRARFGEDIVLDHLEDLKFRLDEDMARRFYKRFALDLHLWDSYGDRGHLVMAASFSMDQAGLPELLEIALMPLTDQWLPFENLDERHLLEQAVADQRHFVKGMRVNLASDVPIASLSLTDTGDRATAVYLASAKGEPAYDDALDALMQTQGIGHTLWQHGDELPAPVIRNNVTPIRPTDPPDPRPGSTIG